MAINFSVVLRRRRRLLGKTSDELQEEMYHLCVRQQEENEKQ
jgi:hypothetical protein